MVGLIQSFLQQMGINFGSETLIDDPLQCKRLVGRY